MPSFPEPIFGRGVIFHHIRNIHMWFETLTFILGIAFGFFHRGKEDYLGLLRNGAITGTIMAIILVLISIYIIPGIIGTDVGFFGVFGIFIEIILFVLIFIAGSFIGDWLESVVKK
jgi:hypothetical protein